MIKHDYFKQIKKFAKNLGDKELKIAMQVFKFEQWRRDANRQHTNNPEQEIKNSSGNST